MLNYPSPMYQVCKPRKAAGTKIPKAAGYSSGLRSDGPASHKAQTRAKHNFKCVYANDVPPERWGVTTLVRGSRR